MFLPVLIAGVRGVVAQGLRPQPHKRSVNKKYYPRTYLLTEKVFYVDVVVVVVVAVAVSWLYNI